MNEQPQTPSVTTPPPALTPEQIEQFRVSNRRKLIWGLICLIGPTVLAVVTIVAYAVMNFVFSSTVSTDGLYGTPSVGRQIGNVVMFLIGALATLTWLPGIIGGIVLLSTRRKI